MILEKPENIPAIEELAALLTSQFRLPSNISQQGSTLLAEIVSLLSSGDSSEASRKWDHFRRFFREYVPLSDEISEQYISVSKLLERENVRCPHCGGLLMTAKAKQCLHCNADWHEKEEF